MSHKTQRRGVADESDNQSRSEALLQLRHGLLMYAGRGASRVKLAVVRGIASMLTELGAMGIGSAILFVFLESVWILIGLILISLDINWKPDPPGSLPFALHIQLLALALFVVLPVLTLAACALWQKIRPLEGGLSDPDLEKCSGRWGWLSNSYQMAGWAFNQAMEWRGNVSEKARSSGRARDLAPTAAAALLTPLLVFAVVSCVAPGVALVLIGSAWDAGKRLGRGLKAGSAGNGAKSQWSKALDKVALKVEEARERLCSGLKRLREEGASSESFRRAQRRALDKETRAASERSISKRL